MRISFSKQEERRENTEHELTNRDRALRALARAIPKVGEFVDMKRPLSSNNVMHLENVYALNELHSIVHAGRTSTNISGFFNPRAPNYAAVRNILHRQGAVTLLQFFELPLEDIKAAFEKDKVRFPDVLEIIHSEFDKLG